MTTVAPPVGRLDDEAPERPPRRIRPRRPWPGTRATAGGLLVAIAGLGLFAAFQQTNNPPDTLYVVARTNIAPGTVLTADLIGAQRIELPSTVADAAFGSSAEALVLGSVTIEAIGAGELVQRSDIRAGDGTATLTPFEMSFRIDADRAVDGSLRPGERIDVLATLGTCASAPTEVVEHNVLITNISRSADSSLAGERQVITVALDRTEQVVAITSAADKGKLTLIRANRTP